MDNREVERRIALLLADWRANMDLLVADIERDQFDLIGIIADFNGMRPGALGGARISVETVWPPFPARRSTTVRTTKCVPRSLARQ